MSRSATINCQSLSSLICYVIKVMQHSGRFNSIDEIVRNSFDSTACSHPLQLQQLQISSRITEILISKCVYASFVCKFSLVSLVFEEIQQMSLVIKVMKAKPTNPLPNPLILMTTFMLLLGKPMQDIIPFYSNLYIQNSTIQRINHIQPLNVMT